MRIRNPHRHFAPHKTGDATPLGALERAVMEVVWAHSTALSVGEVHGSLDADPPVAYTTVKTTMERLADKRILVRSKAGRAYQYQAALSREALERRIVTRVLDRLVEQFPDAVASFFVRPDPTLTTEQLALLQEAIDRQREKEDD